MKKYSSVLAMIARRTLYKNLAVMFLTAVAQITIFTLVLTKKEDLTFVSLTETVNDSLVIIPLAVGFALVCIFLVGIDENRGSKQGYLLDRLQITKNSVFALQALYNGISLVVFWATEVVVLFGQVAFLQIRL